MPVADHQTIPVPVELIRQRLGARLTVRHQRNRPSEQHKLGEHRRHESLAGNRESCGHRRMGVNHRRYLAPLLVDAQMHPDLRGRHEAFLTRRTVE